MSVTVSSGANSLSGGSIESSSNHNDSDQDITTGLNHSDGKILNSVSTTYFLDNIYCGIYDILDSLLTVAPLFGLLVSGIGVLLLQTGENEYFEEEERLKLLEKLKDSYGGETLWRFFRRWAWEY